MRGQRPDRDSVMRTTTGLRFRARSALVALLFVLAAPKAGEAATGLFDEAVTLRGTLTAPAISVEPFGLQEPDLNSGSFSARQPRSQSRTALRFSSSTCCR